MNGNWQWQEMVWDSPAAPAVGAAALECLATAVEVGPVVLELRAWAGGACWLVGCQPGRAVELEQLLGHHLPARLHHPQRQRPAVGQAVRLQVRGSHVSTSADRVIAATRALYACLSGLHEDQQAVVQLLIGRRLPSSSFAGSPAPGWRELFLGQPAPRSPERPTRMTSEQHGAAACLRLGYTGTPAQAHQLFSRLLGGAADRRDAPGPVPPGRRDAGQAQPGVTPVGLAAASALGAADSPVRLADRRAAATAPRRPAPASAAATSQSGEIRTSYWSDQHPRVQAARRDSDS